MKTFDFGKGNLNESKVINNKVNEERVDEMFGAILVCSVLCGILAKNSMNWWNNWQEYRSKAIENKQKYLQNKMAYKQTKAEYQQMKQLEKDQKQMAKSMVALQKALSKMPDGPEKEALTKSLNSAQNINSGNPSKEDLQNAQKEADKTPTTEQKNIIDRVENQTNQLENTPEVKKLQDEYTQKLQKQMDAIKNAKSKEELDKVMKDFNIESTQKEQEEKTDEKEPKTDDEIKQELKDKCKDLEGEAIPEQVRGDDGKFSEEKLNGLSGDDLKKTANAAGIKTTKDAPKPEDKKDGEEETKPEDKKDGEGEEDDPQDTDERTDNDDDLVDMDADDIESKNGKATINLKNPKKNPAKLYKKRTYKRGDKTFTTKNFYSKNGLSITPQEYQDAVQNWEKKNKKKNESLGFSITPLSSTAKKQTPVTEVKGATDRVDIIKERLIYIKYVMDTTSNSVEKVQMERMYNALYNLTFNSDGTPRSLKDLYTYLNQVMIENKGKIEGLPTETQIENIDKKVQAFKELHEDKYKAYLTRLDKELLDKAGNKDNDAAADLLHPAGDESDSEIINKIREMSSIYGFTNIIGLEPERKPSPEDDNKKDEIELQQKAKTTGIDTDDNKDVKADDVSDEQIDKIIGVSK